ncbi:MAG: type 4a pilus biogenesis protein PilO [bacterium]|nr:type 4a pilus biogenesis protein PilO [bacterium]
MKLILSIVILGGAVVVFLFFARPELDKISLLRAEEGEISQSLAELQELARLRDALLSQYNAVNPLDIERLDKIVPSKIDSGLLIAELESFAQQYNIVLESISITDEQQQRTQQQQRGTIVREVAEQPFEKLPLTLSIVGTYSSFRNFLTRLEMNTRVIDIAEIRFNAGDEDFYEFQIDANTYWIGAM